MHTLLGTDIGNYRVERLLGSGGTSDVYLLRHRTLATLPVLNVLPQVRLPPARSAARPKASRPRLPILCRPSLVYRFEQ